jgi:hypothetical protein
MTSKASSSRCRPHHPLSFDCHRLLRSAPSTSRSSLDPSRRCPCCRPGDHCQMSNATTKEGYERRAVALPPPPRLRQAAADVALLRCRHRAAAAKLPPTSRCCAATTAAAAAAAPPFVGWLLLCCTQSDFVIACRHGPSLPSLAVRASPPAADHKRVVPRVLGG